MANFEQRDMSGALFPNEKFTEGGKMPRYKGRCMIGGQLVYVSAWVKDGSKGKFMSLAFELPRDPGGAAAPAPARVAEPKAVQDDDIPF
jgi:hypothetical protein